MDETPLEVSIHYAFLRTGGRKTRAVSSFLSECGSKGAAKRNASLTAEAKAEISKRGGQANAEKHKEARVTRRCAYCDNPVTRKPSAMKALNAFCGKECHRRWRMCWNRDLMK